MSRWSRAAAHAEDDESPPLEIPDLALSRPWQWVLALAAALLTAGLFVAAFPRGGAPEAAYVALIPISSWIFFCRPSRRAVIWNSLLAGWLQWIVLLWWLRHFPEQVGLPLIWGYLGVVLLSGVVALFLVGWCVLADLVLGQIRGGGLVARLVVMFGLAAAWVMLEWVRSWVLTGFPWLPLAASQWQRPLMLQILPWTGAWGLSFVLVLFNLGLVFYVRHLVLTRRKPWFKRLCAEFYLGLTGIFLTVAAGVTAHRPGEEKAMFRAGFIQPYMKPPDRWNGENLQQLQDDFALVCRYAAFDGAEVILWPEASTPLPAPGPPAGEAWLNRLSAGLGMPILLGNLAFVREPDGSERWYNAIVEVTPEEGVSPVFAPKRHLVPFGEYVPRWVPFLDRLIPLEGELTPGKEPQTLLLRLRGQTFRVGPLVCYEDVFPRLSRELVRAGVDFLFVATNDAWYGEEGAAYQHAAHSVLRAAETRRPVLRAGNAGWSGWIDEYGQIRHWLAGADGTVYFQGADAIDVARNPWYVDVITPFVRWGDWFVGLCGFLVVWMLVHARLRGAPPAGAGETAAALRFGPRRRRIQT